ncbi:MAG: hypothetical protein R3C20_12715 [Planctomycetaceae bacterium]
MIHRASDADMSEPAFFGNVFLGWENVSATVFGFARNDVEERSSSVILVELIAVGS